MSLNQLADIIFIISAVLGIISLAVVVPAVLSIARDIRRIKEDDNDQGRTRREHGTGECSRSQL